MNSVAIVDHGARPAESAGTMKIYSIDPIRDPRWEKFLQTHADASVFHTPAWLNSLRRTYRYEPIVFTTSAPHHPLNNGFVFSRIQSWLTGSRLVSVPFADHCQPLLDGSESSRSLAEFIPTIAKQEHCDYIETRLGSPEALGPALGRLSCSGTFFHHVLDLRPTVETLFDRLHKSCFQRKIRRAETESLSYAEGTFDSILKHFYSLFVLTRRRHGVPPQPFAWFRNLRDQFGDAMKIGMVSKNNRPVASMLTLRYKTTVVYKYGCSDAAFHKFGGMPFLFWHTIQRAKSEGATELDLGRSDVDADGLIAFKNHLGATATTLTYYRYPASLAAPTVLSKLMHSRKVSSFFAHLPPALLRTAGNLFYRHVG